ncbi:hypothetical protein [Acetobacter aceti]|uniref:Uncharacterized protein n=2 Tax=Acetobacteraceae TaxID=433 RepID=A0A6S6PN42_ACEAC|nr:hypothetical protein AAJCM20276_30840 [Acetobacter aceti]
MMVTVLPFELPGKKESRQSGKDKIWAVVAMIGRKRKVASIHTSRDAALADCQWRREQVTAYARFLAEARDPAPDYHITLIYKGELPKGWVPMPALGILHGRFI